MAKELENPEVWHDREKSTQLSRELAEARADIEFAEGLRKEFSELAELARITAEDESMAGQVNEGLDELKRKLQKEELKIILSGKYDKNSA